jgi:hypothetical protein
MPSKHGAYMQRRTVWRKPDRCVARRIHPRTTLAQASDYADAFALIVKDRFPRGHRSWLGCLRGRT